ncbi:MAG: GNAT family N-acetyltransferase [Candidatus Thorarchaeota archaeon]|jgi:GNAT superfamily N-acetyltransferase
MLDVVLITYKMRDFHWDEDFELARRFLGELFNLTGEYYTCLPSTLENERYGQCGTGYTPDDDKWIKIWDLEDEEGTTIVAVTILKSYGHYWINVHPEHRELVRDIIPALEEQRMRMGKGNEEEPKIGSPVPISFKTRIAYLKEFGYEDGGVSEHDRIRPLDLPPPDFQPPAGYTVRQVRLPEDFDAYRDVLSSVFAHCSNMTENLAQLYTQASFYNDELDLVVEAPDGSFGAFVTVRIDPISRMAELEPVGTHPDHRGLGLGKAVCAEGIRRVQKYNPSCISGRKSSEYNS